MPVTVTDKKGELVLDLSQKDFHVLDRGVEQTIDRFDLDGDPLAVALVVEASSHIQAMARGSWNGNYFRGDCYGSERRGDRDY